MLKKAVFYFLFLLGFFFQIQFGVEGQSQAELEKLMGVHPDQQEAFFSTLGDGLKKKKLGTVEKDLHSQQKITKQAPLKTTQDSKTDNQKTTRKPTQTNQLKLGRDFNSETVYKNLSRIEKLFLQKRVQSQFNVQLEPSLNVNEVLKKPLLQFGYHYFRNSSDLFISDSKQSIDPGYVLGPGDKLIVYILGKVEQTIDGTLDRNGRLYIPGVGHVHLLGVPYDQVNPVVKNALRKKYANVDVSVSLKEVKSVKIFVLGDVVKPGAYNLSALSTVFHALYASSGPTKIGSLRKIKLIRNRKVVKVIDFYDYLLNGDRLHDVSLRNNDTIFVPPIGKVAKISGAVKRPAIYELKKGETIASLIGLSGGLTMDSYQNHVLFERIKKNSYRQIFSVHFKTPKSMMSQLSNYKLRNGDSVVISPIEKKIKNFVTIKGLVHRPGVYQYKKGLTLQKLINKVRGFEDGAYLNRVEVLRYVSKFKRQIMHVDLSDKKGQSFVLQDWDIINVYSHKDVFGDEYVTIEGAVQKAGSYKLLKGMSVMDLVLLAKIKSDAHKKNIEVFRYGKDGKSQQVLSFDYHKLINTSKG